MRKYRDKDKEREREKEREKIPIKRAKTQENTAKDTNVTMVTDRKE